MAYLRALYRHSERMIVVLIRIGSLEVVFICFEVFSAIRFGNVGKQRRGFE